MIKVLSCWISCIFITLCMNSNYMYVWSSFQLLTIIIIIFMIIITHHYHLHDHYYQSLSSSLFITSIATKTGHLRHIVMRIGVSTREVMVCLVAASSDIPFLDRWIDMLTKFPFIKSILLNINANIGEINWLVDGSINSK